MTGITITTTYGQEHYPAGLWWETQPGWVHVFGEDTQGAPVRLASFPSEAVLKVQRMDVQEMKP